MKSVTKNIYEFSDLSDEAKQVARDWYRASPDYEWWDYIFDDAKTIGGLMGIEIDDIYFSGFSSQGDGACFVGEYAYKKGAVAAIQEYAPTDKYLLAIVKTLAVIQRPQFYQLTASIKKTGRYSHEYSVEIEHSDSRENRYTSIFDESPKWWDEIDEALRDFMRWIYRNLEVEYEYITSDEYAEEFIMANEYEFTEDGKIY